MIKNFVDFPIEGIIAMEDMASDVYQFYESGYPVGVKCAIPAFDELLSFMAGQITTISGIPQSGKSEFTDWIITQMAKLHNWVFGVCSFENQPSSLHVTKLMEKYSGKSFAYRHDATQRMQRGEVDTAMGFISEYFYFININTVEVTLEGILAKAAELVQRKGIKGLLIDPWNYIEYKAQYGQTETMYVSECLTKMKAFASKYGVHVFLIAHPTKMPKVNGKYEIPTMYNISGSAHFFNKTDNGIVVHRDYEKQTVDIHVQKVRYSWLGKQGTATFTYNTMTRQYESTDKPPPDYNSYGMNPIPPTIEPDLPF